jgi:predicted transcriptional regulator
MISPEAPERLKGGQVAEIGKALSEADRGEFASEEEVARGLAKWSRAATGKPRS